MSAQTTPELQPDTLYRVDLKTLTEAQFRALFNRRVQAHLRLSHPVVLPTAKPRPAFQA